MIEMMTDQIPGVPRKTARKQAIAALTTMMGTLVLSRIAGTGEFSDEILGLRPRGRAGTRGCSEAGSEEG